MWSNAFKLSNASSYRVDINTYYVNIVILKKKENYLIKYIFSD